MKTLYLIDTNVFIESSMRFYAVDICSGFWDFFRKCATQSPHIKSIDKVYDEFTPENKTLEDFRKYLYEENFFLSSENITQESFIKVTQALQSYPQNKVSDFCDEADYFLIALAYQKNAIIVTQEAKAAETSCIIKIPNVCQKLNIKCIDIAQFLRLEKVEFILKK